MIEKVIEYLYIVLSALVVGICLLGNLFSYAYKKSFLLPNVFLFVIGIVVISLFGLLAMFLEKKSTKKSDVIIVISVSVLWFSLSVVAAHFYYFVTGWDVDAVYNTARTLADGTYSHLYDAYFSIFPNNAFLTCLFSLVIRLGYLVGFRNEYFCLIIFQCFSMMASGVLTFFSVKKLSEKKGIAYLSWFMFMILCGLSPWVVVPYSDTVGLFFISAVIFLYSYRKLPFLIGFLIMTGYFVKPCVLVFGIAVALVYIVDYIKNHKLEKKLIMRVALALAGMILGFAFVKGSIKLCHIEIDSSKTFDVTQFIMMGLNEKTNGAIDVDDQSFSLSIEDPGERRLTQLRVAGERIKNMGPVGLLRHMSKKVLTSYNDGTFAWGVEGDFFRDMIWTGHSEIEEVFRSFYYPEGTRFGLFQGLAQCIWLGVLAFSLVGGFFGEGKSMSVMRLTLIGTLLFELLFEPRARHLLVALPIFFYLASTGFYGGVARIKAAKDKVKISRV